MKMNTDYMIKTDKLWELETLSYLKNDKYGIKRKNINKFHVAPNIFPWRLTLYLRLTYAEHRHRTQDTNTAHFHTWSIIHSRPNFLHFHAVFRRIWPNYSL